MDKLDKIGWDGVRAELGETGLPAGPVSAALETISQLQDLSGSKIADALGDTIPGLPEVVCEDLVATAASLDKLTAARPLNWQFDPMLVRGMGYYTGQIFEITKRGVTSSLAGGGRYDKLIGRWLGRDVPACGFSIGFERIIDLLATRQPRDAIAVLTETDVPVAYALGIARDLRADGQVVEVVPRSGKFGAQLSRLEAGFIAFVHVRQDNGATVRGDSRQLGADEQR